MARPLTPQEATEMIMALRRQQPGSPSHRPAASRRTKRSGGPTENAAHPTPDPGRDNENEE